MSVSSDWIELLEGLNRARARYLIVGAHAVSHYVEPRYTKDLDLFAEPSPENAARVYRALREFGAPLADAKESDFANSNMVFQMGIEPNRVDILMGIDGVEFSDAWPNRVEAHFASVPVNMLSRADLLKNKRIARRPQDILDVRNLEQAGKAARAPVRRPPQGSVSKRRKRR